MSISNFWKCESGSRKSTEEDSCSEGEGDCFYPRTNAAKHKTELCKTFSELGCCPYQQKCRFAHGRQELIRGGCSRPAKNRKCNGFWKNGHCSYGLRCQFGHAEYKWDTASSLCGLESICQPQTSRISKLLRKLI